MVMQHTTLSLWVIVIIHVEDGIDQVMGLDVIYHLGGVIVSGDMVSYSGPEAACTVNL